MILDLIQIFRARSDKALASKLAVRFAQGQLLERATAPLLIVHISLWSVSIIAGAITLILFAASETIHGAIGFAAIIPLILCILPAWMSLRLKAGLDRIRAIAAGYSDAQLDRLFDRDAPHSPTPPSDNAGELIQPSPQDNRNPTRDAP